MPRASGATTSSGHGTTAFPRPSRAESSGLCAAPIPNRTFATPHVSRPFLSHARSKSATQQRADRIGDLARKISVPRAALSGMDDSLAHAADVLALRSQPFVDPDPYGQLTYASRLDALRGVSDMLHRPLARD